MTDDEIQLLEDATEGITPLWEAAWSLQDRTRAVSSLRALFYKGFIDFYINKRWADVESSKLSHEETVHFLHEISSEQNWDPEYSRDNPYYSFCATVEGNDCFFSSEAVKDYIRRKRMQTEI